MSRFIIFIALFLSIYGSLHLYVLIKARRAFYLQNPGYLLTVVLLAFLTFAPIQARILEAQNHFVLSTITAWIGNVWMGGLFFFICLSLPLDGYHIALSGLQHLGSSDLTHLMLSRRQRFAVAALISAALMAYGVYEAHRIKPEVINLESAKIPAGSKGLRIVQISDLHIGAMSFPARIKPVIDAVKAAQPDILVSTGDLVDGHALSETGIAAALNNIPAPLGKFAVTGNHESYIGLEESLEFTRQAGFTLLRNNHRLIKDTLAIVGVDDPAAGKIEVSETKALGDLSGKYFTLLLKHRPVIDPQGLDRFDLQLSGHVHKGQIFPFNLLVGLFYEWESGTHQVSKRSRIHINRGSGSWGPPFRLLAPPEITIINLLPSKE